MANSPQFSCIKESSHRWKSRFQLKTYLQYPPGPGQPQKDRFIVVLLCTSQLDSGQGPPRASGWLFRKQLQEGDPREQHFVLYSAFQTKGKEKEIHGARLYSRLLQMIPLWYCISFSQQFQELQATIPIKQTGSWRPEDEDILSKVTQSTS